MIQCCLHVDSIRQFYPQEKRLCRNLVADRQTDENRRPTVWTPRPVMSSVLRSFASVQRCSVQMQPALQFVRASVSGSHSFPSVNYSQIDARAARCCTSALQQRARQDEESTPVWRLALALDLEALRSLFSVSCILSSRCRFVMPP